MKNYLTTVPHIVVEQGKIWEDEGAEMPIDVVYYSNCISLEQDGNELTLSYQYVDKLFKTIKKHKAEALEAINNRK